MELKIGKRIQDLRKQKGLTQEQVAAALNISAAAVSKWETDTTYPDITILNPLARLLGVSVDVLLDFQEQMTEEECMKRMEKADTLFSTRNWEEGQQYCEELLKEFPTDLFLKFRVASTYMQYAGASLQEEILKQQMERSITLFEESTASENAEISETAWYVLSGLYCMNEEYEKGLEAVEKLPQPDFDARSMKSSILYQMGKLEESEKLTQRCLYEEIRNAGLSLVSLAKIAGEESEYEKAFRFLDAAQELETLFEESRLGGVNVMVSQMKLGILVKQGKKDQALLELKHLVMGYLNIVQGRKTETPIYFDKLEWNESTSPKRGYLLENLLWLLETEDVYAELRAEDVYREMVEKISKGTGKKQIKFAPQKWKRAFAGRPCFLFNLSSCSCILVVFEICKDFFFVRILFLLSCSSYNVNKCYNIYDQCKETDNRHHGRICICASAGSDSV